ncbi:magnesium transporter [Magnetococcus marinus MC-1]|uniref:Magnesium transporter MgtE n=1 Tax=Magnetococcus marinus (strain ATCC BAA-1437 / JCM 17883 / MC-1) TaxID=156889 RepID=A0LC72_MAGMM|nr:magnesium transporter [Magnetococcus marinus]ABK45565.1 magnesium transporter [Magnetococcus marinus MC-1]
MEQVEGLSPEQEEDEVEVPEAVIVTPGEGQSNTDALIFHTLEQLANEQTEALHTDLRLYTPAEIADLLESLPLAERQAVAEEIDPEVMPDVLSEMQVGTRSTITETLDLETLTASINALPEPYAVELLDGLPEELADEIRESLDPKARQRLEATLEWEEGSAGRLMHVDEVSVRTGITLATIQRYLRFLKHVPTNSDGLMIVDREGFYLGKVSFAAILTHPPETLVESVMDRNAVAVQGDSSEEEVARLFEQRDLLSVAVVDELGMLVGRISIDDVVDVIRQMADEQMMHMANLHELDDTFGPVLPSARRRAVWLGINLLTAFLASWVIGLFQGALEKIVALAVLMPIVSSMGGITGSQTLALVIRGLSLGTISSSNARQLAMKELAVGTLNGVLWAVVVAGVTMVWFHDYALGAVIGVALVLNMGIAALSGWGLPLLLTRYGQDPAISGSVLLTTVTDVVGFMGFLGLATLLLL